MAKNNVRVRFAPSPTGYLHIGGLRTALFNWLFARHNNGTFLIRIEDTDRERSKQEFTDSILASLKWTGIEADEPIVVQSKRQNEHQKLIAQLVSDGKAYPCSCSQEEIKARHDTKDYPYAKYDGLCRDSTVDKSQPYAIRFKLPLEQQTVSFDDLIRGSVSFDIDQLDDFIIQRSDGNPTYNFVVVADDEFMNITDVIRGEDHISNTPKQILLYQALAFKQPQFAHLPLILGKSGQRLSKRDAATSVLEYKQAGYLPDALINYLARLGWAHGDQEIFSSEELIKYFSLDNVGKSAAIFDLEKLAWLNGLYIRETSNEKLLQMIMTDVAPDIKDTLCGWNDSQIIALIGLYKQRVKTLKELVQELMLLHGISHYQQEDLNKWVTADTKKHIRVLIDKLNALENFKTGVVKEAISQCGKELGVKLVNLAQPVRIALMGKASGPGVFELLSIIKKDESLLRLQELLAFLTEDYRYK